MTRATIRIDLAANVPAFRQIANSLRALLVDNAFQSGQQLPTIRQLAIDLGVHPNTVADAYRVLADEGWIEMRRRHGVRVINRRTPNATAAMHESFSRRFRELVAEARGAGVGEKTITDILRRAAGGLI
jgi:DNA-binding transcriptional regulator YhcF (GntR family)